MDLKNFLKQHSQRNRYTFGEFIAQRREELGLSMRECAAKLEISAVYLCDIEKGHRPAPTKLISKIKTLLDINIYPENEKEFEDLLFLTRNECSPDLIQYLLASKEARQAIRLAIDNDISGSDLLKLVKNSTREKNLMI